ncbi:MAG: hypothetical protein CL609_10405 [Anaerolineaceae bacterium]|nr:hypothetical protein [Anaerolineaceae bacterium]
MIMGLALLIYALAERQLRLALQKSSEKIPDQKGKPTATPTIRWIFQVIVGFDILLSIWVNGQRTNRQMLNPRPVHEKIIKLFGIQVRNCYFLDS